MPPSRDEIARLGATLNLMLDRLEAALEHERQFVADASHELRTPLSLLQAELEFALRRPRDPRDLLAALASALEETVRLVALTEDLLLLARADRRETEPVRASLDADRWPRHAVETASTLVAPVLHRVARRLYAGWPQARIMIDCPEHLTVLLAPEPLERAVTNLLHNALQHGRPPITVLADRVDDRVEVLVRDHGAGFAPGFLPRAFDRFTQADAARSRPGSGLGLAIIAAIARQAGGSFGARNAPDGTEVWICLPAGLALHRQADARTAGAQGAGEKALPPARTGRGTRAPD